MTLSSTKQAPSGAEPAGAGRPRGPRFGLRAGVAGALALLAGAGLTLAPVTIADTQVTWPKAGEPAESTILLLTNQTPYALDIEFDADAARAADDEVLFATMDPDRGDARALGLVLSVDEGELTVAAAGRTEEVAVPDEGRFAVHSDVDGLTLSRDGEQLIDWPEVLPPQVDALITEADGASITARLQVFDDFNSTATPLKVGIMVLLWLALAYALFSLWRDDRDSRIGSKTSAAPETRPWWRRLTVTDALVIAALAGWVFIGPMTDDDGYYANMALNYGDGGYVGNYYQMFNQSFTPFTWFWQFLYFWQELGGRSPVWLRLPALIAAVIAWFLTRSFFDRMLGQRGGPWLRRFGHLFLGLVYVAWWLPYAIGTRPEILGALGSAIALALVARAVERRTLLPAAFAAMAAGLAFAAHPTGGVAFAPVVLAIPALWSIARRSGTVVTAVARTAGVLSAGSVALFAAFFDASMRDFLVGSARFAAVEVPLDWTDEGVRYGFLLSDSPMGAYAKRAVVLVALVALLWFVILWTVARLRRSPAMGFRMTIAGWSLALGLIALWVTTSKWTHHFGALSVLGPILLGTVFFVVPAVARELLGERRMPPWLVVVVTLSFLPPAVVALQGPNTWAYAWNQFMFRRGVPPGAGPFTLGTMSIWLPIAVVCLAAVWLLLRRRGQDWRGPGALLAATAFVTVFFTVSTGFLYASFANAAVRGLSSFSVGAANLKDPTGSACLAEEAITLWDATRGTALRTANARGDVTYANGRAPQAPAPELIDAAALPLGGWPESGPPPANDLSIWADSEPGLSAARETAWYELPASLEAEQRIGVLVGGAVTDEVSSGVLAQVGRVTDDGVTVDREIWVTDAAERPGWRTLVIDVPAEDLRDGAVLRLVGIDGSAASGAWFGFSEPRLMAGTSMSSAVPHGEPTLAGWQESFWFPCQRPMRIANGIIEPPLLATTWADVPPDNIWVERRGGALAGVARIATVNTPATDMVEAGPGWGRVSLFEYPYATDGYTLTRTPQTVPGWGSPFGPSSQLVEAERLKG